MQGAEVLELGQEAIFVLLKVSLPLMLVALIVGVIISLLQALTQIQEATLTFVPKIVLLFLALVFFLPYMSHQLQVFAQDIFKFIQYRVV